MLAHEALWEGDSESSFTADDRFIISTALARLSKIPFNDFISFRERVGAGSTNEAEQRPNPSAASDQMARTTAELCRARDTISTQ